MTPINRSSARLFGAALLLALLGWTQPAAADGAAADGAAADGAAADSYATLTERFASQAPERLAAYIRIDTTNPPGNESAGVAYLGAILDAAGIPYESAESAPGRGNLWARLPGSRPPDGGEPALVLLHHIDVVDADPRYWSVDPFGGEIRDGYVWGRGALDMKGTAIAQLQAFLALHASGKRLNRDVLLVATADEEAGGALGAGWLIEHHPEIFAGAGFLLNEGGSGTVMGDDVVLSVEVTQKVPLWLRLTAHGQPGHGSAPQPATAVTRLLRAGDRLAQTSFAPRVVAPVRDLFEGIAPYQPEPLRERYASIDSAVQDDAFMRYLQLTDPGAHALLRNTCSITRLEGSSKINVVPTEAAMELDCRLLPDQDPQAFIAEVATIVNDPAIAIETLLSFTPAVSPTSSSLYRMIEATAADRMPAARVIPGVLTGFTDSHYFRDLGIASYGFNAFVIPREDRRGVHGNDERIGVDTLVEGTRFMIELVDRFTTQ
ncbi:MAG: M20/M25/M40 family metallo-hydrolase [Pseudomonadales bacterium]